jgi:DnaJ-class molecular chaperone
LATTKSTGDLIVTVDVQVPSHLTAERMNLEGIRRAMALANEVEGLGTENDRLRSIAASALGGG